MKILCVNDYQLEKATEPFIIPLQHCWGVDYIREQGDIVDTIIYNGYSPNRFFSLMKRLWFNIKLLIKSLDYDIIISFNSPLVDFLSIFKSLRLTNIKLFTFCHHEGRAWQINKSFNKVFFLSKAIMKKYEGKGVDCEFMEWAADLAFYDHYKEVLTLPSKLHFVSTGRTHRDINIIERACKATDTTLTLIESNRLVVDGEMILSRNQNFGQLIDRPTMVQYMNKAQVSFISVKKEHDKNSLCGLNSFIEALALGQAIIMSDNTNIDLDIESLKIGFVYKAGDLDDLISKINIFLNTPSLVLEYGKNARKYAEAHSYKDYCKALYKSICE